MFPIHRITRHSRFQSILTEISSLTWGAGAFTTMTFDAGATDPIIRAASGFLQVEAADFAIDNQGDLRLYEGDAGGSQYVSFEAPATLALSRTCVFQDSTSPIPDSCVGDGTDDDLPDADEIVETMLKAVDAASDEECLTYETTTGDFEWQACCVGGGGTVTGVALSMPAEWSVAGSPITTSGTFTVTEATQTANTVYAGPTWPSSLAFQF